MGTLDDPPPVLVLTTFDEDETLWGAIEAGVAGFILKDATAADLIAASGRWPAVVPGSTAP